MRASLHGNVLQLRFPYNKALVERVKGLPFDSRKWDDVGKFWSLTVNLRTIQFVLDEGFQISEDDVAKLNKFADKLMAKEANKKVRASLSKATSASEIPEIANLMKIPAAPYQWVPVNFALHADGRFLLGDDMGLGKSVESIMVTQHPKWKHKPVCIVTPVLGTFQAEILKFFGEQAIIVEGPLEYLNPKVRYYILTYERLKHLLIHPKTGKPRPKSYVDQFFFIFDEAHKLKNPSTKRNRYAKLLTKYAENVILMTGTPVQNRPDELYQLLSIIDPNFMSWSQFMKRYCGAHWDGYGMNHSGHSNLQELNHWLYENVFVRREKEQVLSQLPPKIRQFIDIKASGPVQIQASSMFEMFAESARQKAADPDFIDWLETVIDEVPKIGIFAYHQTMMDAIEAVFKRKGYDYIRIDGSTSQERRFQQVTKFQKDSNCRGAILSIGAASEGLNGLQVAQVCVFAELFWVPGIIEQAENRFHRPGQQGSVLCLSTLYSQFEYALAKLLLQKLSIVRRATSVESIPDSLDDDKLLLTLAKEFGMPLGAAHTASVVKKRLINSSRGNKQ